MAQGFADISFLVPSGHTESVSTKTTGPTGTNGGTLATPCTITATIANNTSSFRVDLWDSAEERGGFVLLQRNLSAADVVVIDTAKHLVLVNGVDARPGVSVLSDYFTIPPGVYSFTSDPAAILTIEYRERWL